MQNVARVEGSKRRASFQDESGQRNLKGSERGFTASWSAGSCGWGIQTVHRERL
jgi:hypothetical protein